MQYNSVVLVPVTITLIVSVYYNRFKHLKQVNWVIKGIRPAVLGLIAAATDRFGDTRGNIVWNAVSYKIAIHLYIKIPGKYNFPGIFYFIMILTFLYPYSNLHCKVNRSGTKPCFCDRRFGGHGKNIFFIPNKQCFIPNILSGSEY